MIKEHKNIETILENLDTKRYPIPEHWPYKDARELFLNPLVKDPATIEVYPLPLVVSTNIFLTIADFFSRSFSVDQVGGS